MSEKPTDFLTIMKKLSAEGGGAFWVGIPDTREGFFAKVKRVDADIEQAFADRQPTYSEFVNKVNASVEDAFKDVFTAQIPAVMNGAALTASCAEIYANRWGKRRGSAEPAPVSPNGSGGLSTGAAVTAAEGGPSRFINPELGRGRLK